MIEKLSEFNIREEKVERLKNKIRNEIKIYRNQYKDELNPNMDNNYPEFEEDYKLSIFGMVALYALEEYINEKHSFMSWEMQDKGTDSIIYVISSDMIDCMLQDEFKFILQLFFNLEDNPRNYYFVGQFMNDHYFAYDFIPVIEKILFDERRKKELNEKQNDN